MKKLIPLFAFTICLLATVLATEENTRPFLSMTKKTMTIRTYLRRYYGESTEVYFRHKQHSLKTPCSTCHSTIYQQQNHPQNTLKVVHPVCQNCHRRENAPAMLGKCFYCHRTSELWKTWLEQNQNDD